MASIKLLLLFLLNYIFVVRGAGFAHSLDELISKANIYYQKPGQAGGELILSNVEQLPTKKNIKMIVHGYTCNRFHFSVTPLKNAYLAKGAQNVLLADWADAALLDYPTSRKAVGPVGKHFAKQLKEFIDKHGIDPSDVHIIGHSLGAHIAGIIGDYFNGRLGRVTGLDPALPLFTPLSSDSLHRSAAQFVDVIHTDFPVFGDGTPRGTVDFYPNFGTHSQPGCALFELYTPSCRFCELDDETPVHTLCEYVALARQRLLRLGGVTLNPFVIWDTKPEEMLFRVWVNKNSRRFLKNKLGTYVAENRVNLKMKANDKITDSCSHFRAVFLFAESIGQPKNFPAKPCSLNGNVCRREINNAASNGEVYMGEGVSRSATGYYYIKTNHAPPYGVGASTKAKNPWLAFWPF